MSNKYFIILNKEKIIFSCLNIENKISFEKNHIIEDNFFEELEYFLNENLINIEKSQNDFIKKIYCIVDLDNNISANLSIRHNLKSDIVNENKVRDWLNDLKYHFTKYTSDHKVVHMIIDKIFIDGEEKKSFKNNAEYENFVLEVRFECIKNDFLNIIKNLLSNYQISVEKVLIAKYLRDFSQNKSENIINTAGRILRGENKNEVIWIYKRPNKMGFFERFFNFFS